MFPPQLLLLVIACVCIYFFFKAWKNTPMPKANPKEFIDCKHEKWEKWKKKKPDDTVQYRVCKLCGIEEKRVVQ